MAAGLLGDLVDHGPRELFARTGVALEGGRLGVWLLGEAGALLIRPGGRRVNCYCVKVLDASLPPSDRIAHLLLALRTVSSSPGCGNGWLRARLLRICAGPLYFQP